MKGGSIGFERPLFTSPSSPRVASWEALLIMARVIHLQAVAQPRFPLEVTNNARFFCQPWAGSTLFGFAYCILAALLHHQQRKQIVLKPFLPRHTNLNAPHVC